MVNEPIYIHDRKIGRDEPVFIIAEAGVNHNGKLELAKKMVDKAKRAGVDAVKFQTFKAEDLVTENSEMADYQKKNISKDQSQYEMIKEKELGYEEFKNLKEYCDEKDILFLSTPHTEEAMNFLEDLVPAYKIGSGDLTNLPFLKKVAQKGKPIILSAGMATLGEVEEAVKTIREEANEDLILLHCVTDYPTDIEKVNLRTIETLKTSFKTLVGFSDHTMGIIASIAAVSLGATVIEKHFTIDKEMEGPDHEASLEPNQLKKMIEKIRDIEKGLGDGIKKPTKEEKKTMENSRKSIIVGKNISKGTKFQKDILEIKRPGTGIKPKYLSKIIGKKAKEDIKKDSILTWDMID